MTSEEQLFGSLWRLMYSHLFQDENDFSKFYNDLFSSSFLRAFELADQGEQGKFLERLEAVCGKVVAGGSYHNQLKKISLKTLISFLKNDINSPILSDFISCIFSGDDVVGNIQLPEIQFLLSRPGLISDEHLSQFLSRFDECVVPKLTSPDLIKSLLSSLPIVSQSIVRTMESSIREISDWVHDDNRRDSDLELTLSFLGETPHMRLFRHIGSCDAKLKEKFLISVAGAATMLGSDSVAASGIRAAFFTVPKIGDVMDRWFVSEKKKYNERIVETVKRYLGSSGPGGLEELRAVLREAWDNMDVSIRLPFGGRVDEKMGTYMESIGDGFVYLPLAGSADVIAQVFGYFPSFFLVNGDMVKLTQLGQVKPQSVSMSSTAQTVPAAGLILSATAPMPAAPDHPKSSLHPTATAPLPTLPEDLRDILLREILQRLPQNAFLHRPYPTKVQPGVYRFGTREVTFHIKSGELQVYRVGDFVSESDGIEFVAREFGVSVDKLRKPGGGFQDKPAISGDNRKPVDWNDKQFLYRLVRRGFKAKDPIWREGWIRQGGPAERKSAPIDFLVKFLEKNIAHAAKQQWAKDLLYEGSGGRAEMSDSDGDLGALYSGGGDGIRATASAVPMSADHPNYKTRLCAMFQQGRCNRGAACGYAHGQSELRGGSQPIHQFYKTRMCNAFLEGRCSRGASCSYAHSETERVAPATGVVRRDISGTQDLRLAAKMEVLGGGPTGREKTTRDRSRSRERMHREPNSKPLPYIPPPRHAQAPPSRNRIDENEL